MQKDSEPLLIRPRNIAVLVVLLIVAMASVQTGAAFAKRLFELIGPAGVTALRLSIAAIVLLAMWRPSFRLGLRDWRIVIAYGISLGAMNLLFYLAIARIPLGVAVALEFTGPLAVAMAASRKPIDFLWIGLAVLGLALLLPLGAAKIDPLGAVLALGAGLCWALYILFGRKAGAALGGQAVALGMTVAAIAVAPVGVALSGPGLFAPTVLAAGLIVAMLSSVVPYSLEMVVLPRLTAGVFGVLMSLEPAIAVLSGFVILAERPSLMQMAAVGCIVAASIGAASRARAAAGQATATGG